MIRAQPLEIFRKNAEQSILRCETFDGETVEFTFTAEGEDRQMMHQDVFAWITDHGDDSFLSLLWSVAFLDYFKSEGTNIFDLPPMDFKSTRLRCGEKVNGCDSYVITFESGEDTVERQFVVEHSEDRRVVTCGSQSWAARRANIRWKLEDSEGKIYSDPNKVLGGLIVLSVMYFDWARTMEHTEEQLKARPEKINWPAYWAQSKRNEERSKLTQEEWAQSAES